MVMLFIFLEIRIFLEQVSKFVDANEILVRIATDRLPSRIQYK